jgi:hypothetical protein
MNPLDVIVIVDDTDSDDCPQLSASKVDRIARTSSTTNFDATGSGHPATSLRPKSEPVLKHSRCGLPSERKIDVIDVDSDDRPVGFHSDYPIRNPNDFVSSQNEPRQISLYCHL